MTKLERLERIASNGYSRSTMDEAAFAIDTLPELLAALRAYHAHCEAMGGADYTKEPLGTEDTRAELSVALHVFSGWVP